jgi:Family of unknown function (DUF6644)
MSLLSFCQWLQETDVSTAIREGALYYPIFGGIHLLSIALFGGMILATDLRLLGWGLRLYPVSDVVGQLRPWKWFGFVVVTASGLLVAWAEPLKLYHSKSFWIKMALLVLVGVHALAFRRSVYGNAIMLDKMANMPAQAKLAATLSLILWAAIVLAGRLIAFDQ